MGKNIAIKSCKDLKIYNLSYKLAMDIFIITKKFPKEELYSLIDQIRRSSRSVQTNIREGFAKRKYENIFPIFSIFYLLFSIFYLYELGSDNTYC